MKSKVSIAISIALLLTMIVSAVALADTLTSDGDLVTPDNQTSIDLGVVSPGAVITRYISFQLVCDGKNHVDNGQTVNLPFNSSGSTIPVGGNLSATNSSIGPIPASWPDDTSGGGSTNCPSPTPLYDDNGNSTVTITAPAVVGTYTYVAKYQNNLSPAGSNDPQSILASSPSVTFTLIVAAPSDTTPPELHNMPADMTVEGNTAGGANVTFTTPTATDLVDANPSVGCSPVSGSFFALGGPYAVTCTAKDASGNHSSASFNVTVVDTTPPVLHDMPDNMTIEGNTAGGANVTFISPTATDIVDVNPSVSCLPASDSFFALGGPYAVTCTATDVSGNHSSATFNVTVEDTTPPVLQNMPSDMTVEGNTTGGANVTFTAPTATDIVDAYPSVGCSPVSGSFFALGGPHAVTCTATDASGNHSSASFYVMVEDTTPPTITFVSRLPGANSFGWNNSAVTVTWSCSDIVGVVAASVSKTVNSEGASQIATGVCEDTSGNTASDTQTGINIDLTVPSITWNGGPSNGSSFYFGSVPAAPTCTAADDLSGPNGCGVTGYDLTVGTHTMTATAYDKAGNSRVETRTYTVLAWSLYGFYQPVDMNGVYNVVKNGSTVPLKFEIFAGPTELTDVASVKSLSYAETTCAATAITDDIETTATGGTSLRYDLTAGQFIFNWKTPSTAGKCYRVTMTTQDGSSLVAFFKLK